MNYELRLSDFETLLSGFRVRYSKPTRHIPSQSESNSPFNEIDISWLTAKFLFSRHDLMTAIWNEDQ